jgi:hypothetical protein
MGTIILIPNNLNGCVPLYPKQTKTYYCCFCLRLRFGDIICTIFGGVYYAMHSFVVKVFADAFHKLQALGVISISRLHNFNFGYAYAYAQQRKSQIQNIPNPVPKLISVYSTLRLCSICADSICVYELTTI